MTQVYVDLDGVLADFDRHHERVFGVRPCKIADNVDWQSVALVKDFYLDIPPMPDAFELWEYVSQLRQRPIVLTGVPRSVPSAVSNKIGWVHAHLGREVQVICCPSKDKSLHCWPGDILIDDWEKYRALWLGKGGRWITHTSAESSIEQLNQLGMGL